MQLLLAFDSFKESLSSLDAARYFQEGFEKVIPDVQVKTCLLSDGGEGFVDALTYQQGELHHQNVTGPLGNPVKASYGLITEKQSAVIEMAAASGLELVKVTERNPLKTTTYGTGELIKSAMEQQAQHIYIGIGGSATVDGGTGMAQALGVRFFDKTGKPLGHVVGGGDLLQIARISNETLFPLVKQTRFTVACDVNNPWAGPTGAAHIFGPQKGATPEIVETLEAGMQSLAKVIQRDLGCDITSLPGGGAAGGLGGMLYALLGAELKSGIEIVLAHIDFEDDVRKADLIVTGEGRIDAQTAGGKVISGIAKVAQKHQVPVLAIGGSIANQDLSLLYEAGIAAIMPLVSTPISLEEAIQSGSQLMHQTGERVARLVQCLPKSG